MVRYFSTPDSNVAKVSFKPFNIRNRSQNFTPTFLKIWNATFQLEESLKFINELFLQLLYIPTINLAQKFGNTHYATPDRFLAQDFMPDLA